MTGGLANVLRDVPADLESIGSQNAALVVVNCSMIRHPIGTEEGENLVGSCPRNARQVPWNATS